MKSSTGRTTLLAPRLRAAQMPTGTPIATAQTVATTTTASVCMAWIHRPIDWISRNATRVKSPKPHFRSTSARATKTAVTTNAWGAVRMYSTALSRNSMTAEMAWNTGPKCAVSQSTSAPTGAPISILGIAVLPLGGERGEQRRSRDDAEEPSGVVGDGERHGVAADQPTQITQR